MLQNDRTKTRLNVIANWMQGIGMSGGERIFIELSKRWVSKINIHFLISRDGWKICEREGLVGFSHEIWVSDRLNKYGYFINYLYRTIKAVIKSFLFKTSDNDIIYSSSDFWPDSLSALIVKLRNKKIKWIAGFYMFAPKPWRKVFPYKGRKYLVGLFYYFTQLPAYWIIKKFPDVIFTTNESDVKKFVTKKRGKEKIIAIQGGIEIEPSREYLNSDKVIPLDRRKYDACFVGRFHPQKGVIDLIDIWNLTCKKRPNLQLAIIGMGELENNMVQRINNLNLKNNIEILGFKDGQEKYEIFKQSKMIIYSSHYGSGGISTYEAMAWGLPAVTYDLEHLKTYCPIGRLKAPCFDLEIFAQNIIELLDNRNLYNILRQEAVQLAQNWDWNRRSEDILSRIKDIIR